MKNILILCILILGCNKVVAKVFTVSGFISDQEISEVRLETSDSIYVNLLKNGKFTFTIPILIEDYVYLDIGKKIPLYVKSYDNIFLDIKKNNVIKFAGKGFEESKFLYDKNLLIKKMGFDDPKMVDVALFSCEWKKFQIKIDNVKQIRLKQLYDFKRRYPNLSESFFNFERQLIDYFGINRFFAYPGLHEMLTRVKPKLPDDYYDFIKRIDTNKKGLFMSYEYQSAIKSLLDFKTSTFIEKYALAKRLLVDTGFFEKIMYSEFLNYVNFNGIDDIDSICVDFIQTVRNIENKNNLQKRYDDWKTLVKGKKAPDFEIKDEKGNLVHLSDFKGKYVYIDCWSSYCGPCIAEMPAIKELANKLRYKNIVLISVSVDQNRKRWLSKIKEFDIDAINLCTGGIRHNFCLAYNIRALPRYILIDNKGFIIDATADKPSVIKEKLHALYHEGVKNIE